MQITATELKNRLGQYLDAAETTPVIVEKSGRIKSVLISNATYEKFLAYEVPYELARERYGGHFSVVANDLHESDDLRVLDYNGERAFKLFSFAELGPQIVHEASCASVAEVA